MWWPLQDCNSCNGLYHIILSRRMIKVATTITRTSRQNCIIHRHLLPSLMKIGRRLAHEGYQYHQKPCLSRLLCIQARHSAPGLPPSVDISQSTSPKHKARLHQNPTPAHLPSRVFQEKSLHIKGFSRKGPAMIEAFFNYKMLYENREAADTLNKKGTVSCSSLHWCGRAMKIP